MVVSILLLTFLFLPNAMCESDAEHGSASLHQISPMFAIERINSISMQISLQNLALFLLRVTSGSLLSLISKKDCIKFSA